MKTSFLSALFVLFFACNLHSQSLLILQSDSTNGKDVDLSYIFSDTNFGDEPRFRAEAWTYGGSLELIRGLIDFDLTSIPKEAFISKATLSLYHDIDLRSSTLLGSNSCWLQRVTSPWKEDSVTWNSQPTTTISNQVFVDSSTTIDLEYPIDVTNLVQDMVEKPDSSFGFMLRLNNEQFYRRLSFASRENINPAKRPRLTIEYYECKSVIIVYDTVRVTVTDTLRIELNPTKVGSNNNIQLVKVFPNPAKDKIYIKIDDYSNLEDYRIRIINTLSSEIFNSKMDQSILEIDINKLGAKGLYFIQIYDDQNNLIDVRKILLE